MFSYINMQFLENLQLAALHPGIALPLLVRGVTDCPVLLPDLLPDCGPSSPQLRHALSVIECT